MEKTALETDLIEAGWHPYDTVFERKAFEKLFRTPTQCHLNRKGGMHAHITRYEFEGAVDYEVEVCGELPDSSWIRLHQYALGSYEYSYILQLIERMLLGWEAVAAACREQQNKSTPV